MFIGGPTNISYKKCYSKLESNCTFKVYRDIKAKDYFIDESKKTLGCGLSCINNLTKGIAISKRRYFIYLDETEQD